MLSGAKDGYESATDAANSMDSKGGYTEEDKSEMDAGIVSTFRPPLAGRQHLS